MADLMLDDDKKALRGSRRWHHFEDRMNELRALGLDCDPIQVLMEVACGQKLNKKTGQLEEMNPAPEPKDRAKAAAELCSYQYPKLKSVEVSGSDGNPIQFLVTPDLTPLPVLPNEEVKERAPLSVVKERVRQLTSPQTIEGELVRK